MTRFRHIYLFSVLGLFGGLIAAAFHQTLLVTPILRSVGTPDLLLWNILLGLCIGAPIGFFPRFAEAAGHHSFREALRAGSIGAAFGGLGGMIAVPVGEWLHLLLNGGYTGRVCATAMLGLAVGFGESGFSGARRWRGVTGGLLGGAFAGFLVEALVSRPSPHPDSAILALLLLGLSIPLAIALSVHIRAEAWLEGVSGPKIARQIYHLGKFSERDAAVLGSSDRCFVWIRGAEPQHATLFIGTTGTVLQHTAGTGSTLVNGNPIREHWLKNGDQIEIADSVLAYRERAHGHVAPVQSRVRFVGKAGAAMLFIAILGLHAAEQYRATVTDVHAGPGSLVSGHVLLTDAMGNPLTDLSRLKLTIFENGRGVSERVISGGPLSSSVLVIDRSGSMKGVKMEAAKAAAAAYVQEAPPGHQVMVIAFDAVPQTICGFTADKRALLNCVATLSHVRRGRTALNDGMRDAIRALMSTAGTRSILALTDGIENSSTASQADNSRKAQDAKIAISIVGLGSDVRQEYLRASITSGGRYLQAALPPDLQKLFTREARFLSARQPFEYKTSRPHEGAVRAVTASAEIYRPGAQVEVVETTGSYLAHLFIPGLKGSLRPYLAGVGALLVGPLLLSALSAIIAVRSFRARRFQYVAPGSRLVGIRDGNNCVLDIGDPAVQCPTCDRPHHARSWRNNKCRCMQEPVGNGAVCYHRALPRFLRHWLDALSGEHTTSSGRRWLCRCAGDEEGY